MKPFSDEIDLPKRHRRRDPHLNDAALSCMLNTELGAVLAVIRRPSDLLPSPDDSSSHSSPLLHSLKSLRSLIFHSDWRSLDPSAYLSPFLAVVQSDDVPAAATAVALSAILKILRLDVFDERTPGARDAIHSVVFSLTNCRLERTDAASEDSVLMRILQLLVTMMKARAAMLLTDHAVCTVVNTCFQVVQQSANRGDVLQRTARHAMHDLIQSIFSRLPFIKTPNFAPDPDRACSGSDDEDVDDLIISVEYGSRCMVDIFHFLCSMLNVGEVVESADGLGSLSSDEDVQVFALMLINSAVELGGEGMGRHTRLLRMIQDDLFHHLIHYATRSSPLVLSMICSIVLNLYHFLRSSLRLQLEAFFTYVLLKIAAGGNGVHLQEVAIESLVSFCQQPTFVVEMYVNYDCDPIQQNIFEEVGKLLCKTAFPLTSPMSGMQVQAFEGLTAIVRTIADGTDMDMHDPPDKNDYNIDITEFKPFWLERHDSQDSPETWVDFVRMRKLKKKKIMIAANHYNRDEKKGLDFLKICHLVESPPDPESFAYFFRYTPGLDKTKIGDYLGDPDEFNLQVLKDFTDTFEFSGVILDTALRTYLDAFRLPGESQKIQRILEAFSERYYDQQSSEIFVSKDAVFILCYSLIMLNTDQHNPQVKKKMTEEEFIRNNRAINGGTDLPREYLSELFHSIVSNAITFFGQTGPTVVEMNSNRWADLIKRSKKVEPFILCDFKHKLSREVFVSISGPSVATLSAIFEQTDDEETLHECVEALINIAGIARYGLEDILDELLSCFCKFTTLLNPYATAEETLYVFSNEVKPRMATLAVFTIANKFGDSIRGAWKNMVDCLLKLKRLRLVPQSVIENDEIPSSETELSHLRSESGVIFPSSHQALSSSKQVSGLIGKFSQFLSLDTESDSMLNVGSQFENNLKIIQQCRIGSIFRESSKLPDDSLQNLGRSLIFAAGGKGQKFSTSVEEEETVGFSWELLATITIANIQRLPNFWPQFHDCLTVVSQFPLFSPCPFAEKAIVSLFKIALKHFSSNPNSNQFSPEKQQIEDLIFKSINLTWKLDKEILDTCCETITESVTKILIDFPDNVHTTMGWKTLFHLLSVAGRHPETFDQAIEAITKLMTEGTHITRHNYSYCIEAAFGFAALKISPLEISSKMLDLMSDSVKLLIQWHKSGYSDPGSASISSSSSSSSSLTDELPKSGNIAANLFVKLAEALRKTSLVRREEIRNQAVTLLQRCFDAAADELEFTPANCIACFNFVIFAMVDDLHEKMVEYSRRDNSEKEMKSMEGTLREAMELLVGVFLKLLVPLAQSPGFRTFWLGVLRRMDTCMKAEGGGEEMEGERGPLQELVPELLRRMIVEMKEKEILVQKEGDELWDVTNIQIQWIAPALKDELFPEDL
ncbi:ARF guanine-nucleotide exchange factor GNL2 [Dioscorea cayenensis subsp. rotundata]|uniref:ARF guanine-nucleotide exchange factor GNL2 n=1 Tax=Dioscorea cayennensis subsp. rotundata TaxID=55577 RepID=A0AB40AUJ1_DIOCR|nr:ARF guanine-nucleotide exchange factor GNL2 [Dioscorea cayenensis subsp. rotundata]